MRPYFLLCSSLLFLCAAYLPAQPLNWPNKIDPTLRTRIQAEGPSEFLVVLSAQADVSDANKLTNKEEKGRYVYETLLQLAESTQGSVRKVLNDAQAPMQSFWVINALWSKGEYKPGRTPGTDARSGARGKQPGAAPQSAAPVSEQRNAVRKSQHRHVVGPHSNQCR